MRFFLLPGLLAVASSACATSRPPEAVGPGGPAEPALAGDGPAAMPLPAVAVEAAPAPASCDAMPGPGAVRRAALVRAADAGVGAWLRAGASVEAKKENGRFRGWIVRQLYPGDACFAQVDLHAGDVVFKLNGRTLETPPQAHDALQSLRSASSLVIDFEREGVRRTLRLAIVDR